MIIALTPPFLQVFFSMFSRKRVIGSIIMSMLRKKLLNGNVPLDDSRKILYLPVEIITEILSWLPANSVLRFKCICKLWLSITEDPEFIHKHLMRVREVISVHEENERHFIRSFSLGLILERMDHTSNFRLRNPTTRRVLDLPDHNNKKDSYGHMLPCHVSSTRTFKMVFPWSNPKDGNGSLKILTVGVDETWRTLDFPFQCRLTNAKRLTRSTRGVYVVVVLPNSLPHGRPVIVFLEVKSEKLWTIEVPQGVITSSIGVDLLSWDGEKHALARRSKDGNELDVWVLEDYENQKWPQEKIVIDLKSMNDDEKNYAPFSWHENKLWMHRNNERYLSFDLRVVRHVAVDDQQVLPCRELFGRPSLVELKGMKPY